MNANEIKKMSIEELIEMHNNQTEPSEFAMTEIRRNDDEALEDISAFYGASWMYDAICKGKYSRDDKYVMVQDYADKVVSFSTPEEFFERVADAKALAMCWE